MKPDSLTKHQIEAELSGDVTLAQKVANVAFVQPEARIMHFALVVCNGGYSVLHKMPRA